MTDDDVNFNSDMIYFRALAEDVYFRVEYGDAVEPFPTYLSDDLRNMRLALPDPMT